MLNAYPRPQLRRESFICLNGEWEFAVTRGERPSVFPERITVPYPPEAPLSGVCRRIAPNRTLWYRRTFPTPAHKPGEHVFLHFGAIDQVCEVFLNGKLLGRHEGGYLPFMFSIVGNLHGNNELVVKAIDRLDHSFPWGKQKKKPGGMWYTPFSGIWQTVWMEVVPQNFILSLALRPTLDSITLTLFPSARMLDAAVEIETPHGTIRAAMHGTNTVTIPIADPILWTPENPHLYPFTVRYGEDTVRSYFALRTISSGVVNGVPRLLLNGEPYFFHGLLDQGYWPDGLCLPPDDSGYARDILAAKAQGFNTLRKHIKVEPLPFYEACDRLGMLVIQDFVNTGKYRFFHDTVLPTLGVKRLDDTTPAQNSKACHHFLATAIGTKAHLGNAPCIVGWTIFNEGWGQFSADEVYDRLKDPSRFYDATSGWFRRKKSDVRSEHVYFRRFRPVRSKKPLLLSEFGGYVFTDDGGKRYGYRFFKDPTAYRAAVKRLYLEEILPAVPKGLCGAIYTQISDVEEEKNGILSYDRNTVKTDPEEMRAIAEALQRAIRER